MNARLIVQCDLCGATDFGTFARVRRFSSSGQPREYIAVPEYANFNMLGPNWLGESEMDKDGLVFAKSPWGLSDYDDVHGGKLLCNQCAKVRRSAFNVIDEETRRKKEIAVGLVWFFRFLFAEEHPVVLRDGEVKIHYRLKL